MGFTPFAQFLPLAGGTLTGPLTAPSVTATGHFQTAASAPAPTMAAGANAGAGPPAPVVGANAADAQGTGTFGTGTVPAAGAQCVVTFAAPYNAAPVGISLDATTAALAPLQPYVSAITAAGFTVSTAVAPAASQPAATYGFSWLAIGR